MTRPGIEPRSRGPLADTLPTKAKNNYCYFFKKEVAIFYATKTECYRFGINVVAQDILLIQHEL